MSVFGFLVSDNKQIVHRSDGLAVIYGGSNTVAFYVNGYHFTNTREYLHAAGIDDEMAVYYLLKYGENLPTKYDAESMQIT